MSGIGPADWLRAPRDDRGVRLAGGPGEWEFRSYAELATSARRVAAALAEDGVRPGDVVCVLLPTGFELLSAFFGAWALGATPCLISPPAFAAEDEYAAGVAAILRQAGPGALVTGPELEPIAARALTEAGSAAGPWLWREAAEPIALADPAGLALLQFTSGSSGTPRGVRVTWDNLATNLAVIRDWLGWREGDAAASWLPLHHDMGLIGCLLTPVTAQGDLWLMRPGQFIRDPARWLECFTFAQHTAAPPFALDYLVRRLRPEQVAALDLSGWRNLIVGAEPIDPAVLADFAALVAPAGFDPGAFRTAYGLAEATLAVTAHPGPEPPLAVRPRPGGLHAGQPVPIERECRVGTGERPEHDGWLVGCGRPRPGYAVSVRDAEGAELPPGSLGEVVVRGPSNADGYHAGATPGSTRFDGEWLYTGDAGFLHRDELFVLGRMGDSLKVRGRSVYVEDLDGVVAGATGLPRNRFAVVGVPGTGAARVALLAETRPGPWAGQAREALEAVLGAEVEVLIVAGRPGLVSRTTSGKPRRRRLAALLLDGTLPAGARLLEPGWDAGTEERAEPAHVNGGVQ